ncbi:MAG: VacJ family lipoprotein, partial [Methylophilaceae bacterium]
MFIVRKIIFISLVVILTACASTPENKDPMEGYNRAIYSFNEVVDDYVAKPVAKGYLFVMPEMGVKGVNNFFNNIRDFITVVNDILQMKFNHAANDAGRVITNTTVGLLGFIDVHSMNGGERRKEDFGQTLAHYGWENSAYFVLPVIGPSTVRDTGGLLVDSLFFDPISYINDVRFRNA